MTGNERGGISVDKKITKDQLYQLPMETLRVKMFEQKISTNCICRCSRMYVPKEKKTAYLINGSVLERDTH